MRCPTCNSIFDHDDRSVICPHPRLDDLPVPAGGFRFPPEARDKIESCLANRDYEGLNKFLYHRNPLVRSYAAKIYEAFRASQT